jgi:hypothetical protein
MNHRLKTLAFKVLQKLPTRLGNELYHFLQGFSEKSISDEYNFQLQTITRFQDLVQNLGLTFTDKQIVELGSGWLPILPYELLYRYKAKEILTFDINKHYQKSKINKFNKFYSLGSEVKSLEYLPSAIRYLPNTNILDFNFDDYKTDVLVSRNVLEHVTPEDIRKIHNQAYHYMRGDSFIIHQISPSDHRAYSDSSLSLWDFLQYSQEEWNEIQTRFSYHNRLRLPHYLQIFDSCGFKTLHLSYKSAKQNQKLPQKVHADFNKFSQEELTAGSILLVLVKK